MSNALRRIAEYELDQCFHDLNPLTRDELATSLVRQWIGNDGNAVTERPTERAVRNGLRIEDSATGGPGQVDVLCRAGVG